MLPEAQNAPAMKQQGIARQEGKYDQTGFAKDNRKQHDINQHAVLRDKSA